MKELSFERMEIVNGGKLTEQEVEDFYGAFACVISVANPLAALLGGGWTCYKFIKSL